MTREDLQQISDLLDQKLDQKLDEKLKNFATKDDLKDLSRSIDERFKKQDEKFDDLLVNINQAFQASQDWQEKSFSSVEKRLDNVEAKLN